MYSFLHDLLETGSVVVAASESRDDESADIERTILEFDAAARLEIACSAPPLFLPAAIWGLTMIENASRFLVYREFGKEAVQQALQIRCPGDPSPGRTYSADLFLRFVPDLARMASAIGPADPLVTMLQNIARQWPLSSVGMDGIECDSDAVTVIASNPALLQLYVDRMLERGDISRLASNEIVNAVRSAMGAHPSLSPVIARALTKYQEQP